MTKLIVKNCLLIKIANFEKWKGNKALLKLNFFFLNSQMTRMEIVENFNTCWVFHVAFIAKKTIVIE